MKILTDATHTHFDEIDSTNTRLIADITSGQITHTAPHLYTADTQTAGRGQHGRTWVGGFGNVFLSLYVPIGHQPYHLHQLSGLLSLMVGYEIAHLDIIKNLNQSRIQNNLPPIGVKWANDIGFYDDKLTTFKKLAGILIEPVFKKSDLELVKNTLVGVVIGVGLNVHISPQITDGLYTATCLKEISKELDNDLQISASDLYTPMANAIFKAVQICNNTSDNIYLKNFINQFNQNHILTNKTVAIFMQNNMTDSYAKGQCIGIGINGELLLQNDDGIQQIYAGMAKISESQEK